MGFVYAAMPAIFFFLRLVRNASTATPVAKSGSAAGRGTGCKGGGWVRVIESITKSHSLGTPSGVMVTFQCQKIHDCKNGIAAPGDHILVTDEQRVRREAVFLKSDQILLIRRLLAPSAFLRQPSGPKNQAVCLLRHSLARSIKPIPPKCKIQFKRRPKIICLPRIWSME